MKRVGPETGAQTVRGMSTSNFDHAANAGQFWIHKGVELLRAALVLQRQVNADRPDFDGSPVTRWPANLAGPAIMLAAMALECALKGVLAETVGVAKNGKLAFNGVKSHDLEALAKTAKIAASNPSEEDALREGKGLITSGRFHTAQTAPETQTSGFINFPKLIDAYRDLFTRAADAAAIAMHGGGRYFDPNARPVEELIAFFRAIVAESAP